MSNANENQAIRKARNRLAKQFECTKVRAKPMLRIVARQQYPDGEPMTLFAWFSWPAAGVFDLLCISDLGSTLRWLSKHGVPRPTEWLARQCPAGRITDRSGMLESDCTLDTAPGCMEAVTEACRHITDAAMSPAGSGTKQRRLLETGRRSDNRPYPSEGGDFAN
jgi:hypothetical protein